MFQQDGLAAQLAVTSKYQIENSPWTLEKTKGVKFEDYRASIMNKFEKEQATNKTEWKRLGDLNKDKSQIEVFDKTTQEEKDS